MKIAIVDDEAYWREKAEECIKEEMKNEIELTVYDNPISYLESKDEYDISLKLLKKPERKIRTPSL